MDGESTLRPPNKINLQPLIFPQYKTIRLLLQLLFLMEMVDIQKMFSNDSESIEN